MSVLWTTQNRHPPQREELPSRQVVQEETAETASQRLQDRRRERLHICHHQNGPAPRPEAQDGEKFRRFQAEAGTGGLYEEPETVKEVNLIDEAIEDYW